VVLVNSSSASASEIVSGALQDLDRAVILGQRTYGKGLVQTTRPLSYNSTVKITTAKYYIPSGRCIQAIDYTNRNPDGSVGKIPDSLINTFKTKNGRLVFDGGGIAPDIKTEPEKYSDILISLSTKNLLFDFATNFKIKNPSLDLTNFDISESLYSEFLTFLKDKDYKYDTNSELALKELKKEADEDLIFEMVEKEFNLLKEKLNQTKQEDLYTFKAQIKEYLKEEIVSRYGHQKARIETSLKSDPEILKALDLLKDKKGFTEILTLKTK
jgi:carboxyl-terminal processing protease